MVEIFGETSFSLWSRAFLRVWQPSTLPAYESDRAGWPSRRGVRSQQSNRAQHEAEQFVYVSLIYRKPVTIEGNRRGSFALYAAHEIGR